MTKRDELQRLRDILRTDPRRIPFLLKNNSKMLSARAEDNSTPLQIVLDFKDSDGKFIDEEIISKVIELMDIDQINNPTDDEKTALHTAVISDRENITKKLLDKGAIVSTLLVDGRNVVHWACVRKCTECLNSLLAADLALINSSDDEGLTPLHIACQQGWREGIEVILSKDKLALNIGDKDGDIPLSLAVQNDFMDVVSRLLRETDNGIDQANRRGETPLDKACNFGRENITKLLLEKGANMECKDMCGNTPLLTACFFNSLAIVEMLVENGANLKARNNLGRTPLIVAAEMENVKIVQYLLDSVVKREEIDQVDANGYTALNLACRFGHKDVAEALLKNGANCSKPSNNGYHALGYASQNRHTDVVKLLLDQPGIEVSLNAQDGEGSTALYRACQYGHIEIAKLLLERNADAAKVDAHGQSCLHTASIQGCKEIVQLLVEKSLSQIDLRDDFGWTALHYASFWTLEALYRQSGDHLGRHTNVETEESAPALGNYVDVIEYLLSKGAEVSATTNLGATPLQLAAEKNHPPRVSCLLRQMRDKSILLMRNKSELTALGTAMSEQSPYVVRLLLEVMDVVDLGEVPNKEEMVLWLAKDQETHEILKAILSKEASTATPPVESNDWNAMEWAAFRNYPRLLWWLLFTITPSLEGDRRVRAVTKLIRSLMEGDKMSEPQRAYERILRILRSPPIAQISEQRQQQNDSSERPSYYPHSDSLLGEYEAEIVDFYSFNGKSGFLRRFESIRNVVYGEGPRQIMETTRDKTNKLGNEFGPRDEIANRSWSENDLRVRWVHLPENNMKRVKDLAFTLSADSRIDNYRLGWLNRSWDEIEGLSPTSCFMKPRFVCKDKNQSGEPMAIYMPYLTLGNYTPGGLKDPIYQRLFNDYKNVTLHTSQTLDEFYHYSCRNQNLLENIQRRNADQVVTKNIRKYQDSCILVNVNQIWIWVIDSKTVITASTNRMDDRMDTVLTSALGYLSQRDGNSAAQQDQMDAFQLAQIIMHCCVRFFDKKLQLQVQKKDSSAGFWKGSIQDTFSNAIAEASLQEAILFNEFTLKTKAAQSEMVQKSKVNNRRDDILKAAGLLRETKDIRDELKALRMVAEYQMSVEKEMLSFRGSSDNSDSLSVVTSIREMDKMAERIENAVNTTLTLEQNEIAISDAQEAIRQGKTLMVFTTATIIFLPLSFLTSFFALDVASFSQTPHWAFFVIFGVSVAFSLPLAAHAFFGDWVLRFRGRSSVRDASVESSPHGPEASAALGNASIKEVSLSSRSESVNDMRKRNGNDLRARFWKKKVPPADDEEAVRAPQTA
ncbi:Ankyrin-R-like protein [Cladobotryum mycophilum]|uniref:Ankyrin-R-like protein n=1 Tax=Cladobotryum mycophilum TaxID=491253 RepID=A0ABR0SV45_9HYPO